MSEGFTILNMNEYPTQQNTTQTTRHNNNIQTTYYTNLK